VPGDGAISTLGWRSASELIRQPLRSLPQRTYKIDINSTAASYPVEAVV